MIVHIETPKKVEVLRASQKKAKVLGVWDCDQGFRFIGLGVSGFGKFGVPGLGRKAKGATTGAYHEG